MSKQQRVFHDIVNPIISMAIQARKFEEKGFPMRWIAREILKIDTVDLSDEQVEEAVNIFWHSLTCEIPPENAPGRAEIGGLLVVASNAVRMLADSLHDVTSQGGYPYSNDSDYALADRLIEARDRLMGDDETPEESTEVAEKPVSEAPDDGSTPEAHDDTVTPGETAVEAQEAADPDDDPYDEDDIKPKPTANHNKPVEGMAGFKSVTQDDD